jgi:hypothetical protein
MTRQLYEKPVDCRHTKQNSAFEPVSEPFAVVKAAWPVHNENINYDISIQPRLHLKSSGAGSKTPPPTANLLKFICCRTAMPSSRLKNKFPI